MLRQMERSIIITTGSRIGEVEAAGFQGTLNSADPLNLGLSSWVANPEVYKQNIAQCRADENEFRAYMQAMQDELLAAQTVQMEETVQEKAMEVQE